MHNATQATPACLEHRTCATLRDSYRGRQPSPQTALIKRYVAAAKRQSPHRGASAATKNTQTHRRSAAPGSANAPGNLANIVTVANAKLDHITPVGPRKRPGRTAGKDWQTIGPAIKNTDRRPNRRTGYEDLCRQHGELRPHEAAWPPTQPHRGQVAQSQKQHRSTGPWRTQHALLAKPTHTRTRLRPHTKTTRKRDTQRPQPEESGRARASDQLASATP